MLKDAEEKWVDQARKGSNRAFDRLIRRYSERIYFLLLDLTGNAEDARDLTQETFIRAWEALSGYKHEARFSTWLYRIATNQGIDFLRRRTRRKETRLDRIGERPASESSDPALSVERREQEETIQRALQELTDMQRSAVVLHYYHGFRMKEIGDILGCSEATSRVHLFRGMQKLRKQLNPNG